ncbi:hypothetical protein [Alcanivorax sp.]|jgi:hypothetical protein|uniref:hypothetical protein n=1 Tax=Alcanivorax sp. TaxID=1872427 RepID=UPI0032D96CED
MLHLLGFSPDDNNTQQRFAALYAPGDICVFTDAGLLLASHLTLKGDGYLLAHTSLVLPDSTLPVIDHAELLTLVAEHGPCTSWY